MTVANSPWDPAAFGLAPAGESAPAAPSIPWDPSAFGLSPAPPGPSPPPQQAAQAPRGTVGRGLALGARDQLEGIVGPFYDAAALPFQAVGLPVKSFSENLDALGLPKPETPSEKFV